MLLRKTCTDFSVHEWCGYRVVYVRACNHTLALSQMLGRIYSQWASLDMGDRMGWVYSWKRGGNRRCCLGLPSSSAAAAAKSLQSCSTLCDPIDGSPSGSPVPGILQARTLECVAISFSNAWKWKVKVKSCPVIKSSLCFTQLEKALIHQRRCSATNEDLVQPKMNKWKSLLKM